MFRTCLIWLAFTQTAFAGDPLQEFLYGEQPKVQQVEDNREVVRIWTATWCDPCRRLHKEIDEAGELPFRIEWIDADKVPMPSDVPNGIPHAEWADRRWYTKPMGLNDLTGRYQATKELPPVDAKPVTNPPPAFNAPPQQNYFHSRRRGRRGR